MFISILKIYLKYCYNEIIYIKKYLRINLNFFLYLQYKCVELLH